MALQSLKDYLTVITKSKKFNGDNSLKIVHVCPKLEDIIYAKDYTSSTPMHIAGNISEYRLKGIIETRERNTLIFYLEFTSDIKESYRGFLWSVSIYNSATDNSLEIGKSIFNVIDTKILTSEMISVHIDKVQCFLQNNKLMIIWLVEHMSSPKDMSDATKTSEMEDCFDITSRKEKFKELIDNFFENVTAERSISYLDRQQASLEEFTKTIDACHKQVLLNKQGIDVIKNDIFEMDKQIGNLFNDECLSDKRSSTLINQRSDTKILPEYLSNISTNTGIFPKVKRKSKSTYAQAKCTTSDRSLTEMVLKMEDELSKFNSVLSMKRPSMLNESNIYAELGTKLMNKVHFITEPKPMQEVDLLLIGKTGNGKSALGNSILGRNAFESKPSLNSVTQKITYDVSVIHDVRVKVVDGPGVGDTRMRKEEVINDILNAVANAICINPKGYHAFLLVIRFGSRFTNEDKDTIMLLKKIFGEHFFKKFCVLVMTCGDLFKHDVETSFQQWLSEQKSGAFTELVKECDNRIILFDNRTKDKALRDKQVHALFRIIENLKSENCRYSDKHFMTAESEREILLVECEKDFISENVMIKVNIIMENFHDIIDTKEPQERIILLEELAVLADKLLQEIKEKDKRTDVLHTLVSHVESLANSIKTEIKFSMKIIEEREKFKKIIEDEALSYDEIIRLEREELSRQVNGDESKIMLQEQIRTMKEQQEKYQEQLEETEKKHKEQLILEHQKLEAVRGALQELKETQRRKMEAKMKNGILMKLKKSVSKIK